MNGDADMYSSSSLRYTFHIAVYTPQTAVMVGSLPPEFGSIDAAIPVSTAATRPSYEPIARPLSCSRLVRNALPRLVFPRLAHRDSFIQINASGRVEFAWPPALGHRHDVDQRLIGPRNSTGVSVSRRVPVVGRGSRPRTPEPAAATWPTGRRRRGPPRPDPTARPWRSAARAPIFRQRGSCHP